MKVMVNVKVKVKDKADVVVRSKGCGTFPASRLGRQADKQAGTSYLDGQQTAAIQFFGHHGTMRATQSLSSMPLSIHALSALTSLRRPALQITRSGRRSLHLAPPWLLDDYIPRYHLLSSIDAAKKRSQAYAHLRECNLCPRLCGVNRYEKTGVCLIGAETVKVNTIAPHFGEGTAASMGVQHTSARLLTPVCRALHPGTQWIRQRLLFRLQPPLRFLPEP